MLERSFGLIKIPNWLQHFPTSLFIARQQKGLGYEAKEKLTLAAWAAKSLLSAQVALTI